jgi:hypothetical protein
MHHKAARTPAVFGEDCTAAGCLPSAEEMASPLVNAVLDKRGATRLSLQGLGPPGAHPAVSHADF